MKYSKKKKKNIQTISNNQLAATMLEYSLLPKRTMYKAQRKIVRVNPFWIF